jgi:hypothetical protein
MFMGRKRKPAVRRNAAATARASHETRCFEGISRVAPRLDAATVGGAAEHCG